MWGRPAWLAVLVAAAVALGGCDDGPDVSRPLEGIDASQTDAAQLAEFCEKLTSRDGFDPTSPAAAQDAVAFLDDLLPSTPDAFRPDVTTLRRVASQLAAAENEQDARRIAREEVDPGVFSAYNRLDTFRTERCG